MTAQTVPPEPRRAREPDHEGIVTRDGVTIAYAVHGTGEPTVLLLPTWALVPSRFWKAQVPYLSRHFRVVTFDGRGSGSSSRPEGAAAYTDEQYAADAAAVLDATATDRAIVVGFSCGVAWSVHLATQHPERVEGLVALAPSCGLSVTASARDHVPWDRLLDTTRGWAKYNKHYWLGGGYDDFVDFFARKMFTEPHSTKQIEDITRWAHETTPQTLADTTAGRLGCDGATCTALEPLCLELRCPVLVVHGAEDAVRSSAIGERFAELTHGSLVVVEGGGHGLPTREPVLVNSLLREFVETVHRTPRPRAWHHALRRPKRALYLSSPIGLGHAVRDLAIARELRLLHPDLQIEWLAQHPVTRVLEAAHERIHPASAWLYSESRHFEDESADHDLHAFEAVRRMDEVLVANFMAFRDVVRDEHYDLVIGDEAWDVDYFLHENPELKQFSYAWMTDFVGWLPMPDGGGREAALTTDYNAEMVEQRRRFPRLRDRSIFIGSPDDIVPDSLGDGLPRIRDWTEANFDFAGYVSGFDPTPLNDRDRLRDGLGYRPDEQLVVVAVGGSGVGGPLLRRVLAAAPLARRLVDGLRFVVVAGPRIDHRSLPRRRGVSLRGYVPNLYQHLAACDFAVVQGGLTTCMELTAGQRPFAYVPLQHHFEQNFHVRHRLERYRAGQHLTWEDACDADLLAEVVAKGVGRAVDYRPVESDGAARAAAMLAELL
ncbi:alpha/beta hydrolase [Segeticoccus rhizosphaerae]|uniref:alpha/beta hydrolase n=1 Tax=Segeticoccus rhizosphaerae TaxID=1104777 RepID=UPI00192E6712|nr:alpha/beta fold hydrolase [Ornithinicoccus soli]